MEGGNFANKVSDIAGNVDTAAEIGALALGATSVGAPLASGLVG